MESTPDLSGGRGHWPPSSFRTARQPAHLRPRSSRPRSTRSAASKPRAVGEFSGSESQSRATEPLGSHGRTTFQIRPKRGSNAAAWTGLSNHAAVRGTRIRDRKGKTKGKRRLLSRGPSVNAKNFCSDEHCRTAPVATAAF
ncbi:MAG: hypothetical protein D6725_08565 [Planctomycetota bacterium]|nr:MAG: hypothetical protein D6725_08565 [Planctomycetota bacterium]